MTIRGTDAMLRLADAVPVSTVDTYAYLSASEEDALLQCVVVNGSLDNERGRRRLSRRRSSVVASVAIASLAAGGGLAAADSFSSPPSAKNIPDQVSVMGPGGVVAGTVPKADLVGPPVNAMAGGQPLPVADTPGAVIVVDSEAGYPVSKNGSLVGYWVPPTGFLTIDQAIASGATPANGAGPVGSS
jgi:hypothetical protein